MLLVTGASGLLGANLVCTARDAKREVVGICRRHPLRISGTQMLEADLTDHGAVRALIASLRPQIIIHCAAATSVDWCEDHPEEAELINVSASSSLAQMAAELNARMVYVSTDSVFDGQTSNYSESDEPNPLNVYAKSKLRGEQEVLRHCPTALIARVNVYGWNAQDKQSLAEWILHQLTARERVNGFTDVYFSPLLANDLAEILLAMLDRGLSGIYHTVGSERVSKYEFARRVAVTFGIDPGQVVPARLTEATLRAPRPLDISLNTEKIRLALGRPMPDVESGLCRFRELQESGHLQQLRRSLAGSEPT